MQKLTVYPNPFTALGPDGMPCGRVLVEPGHPRPHAIVGGKLAKVRVDRQEDMSRPAKERAAAKKLDMRDSLVRGVAHVRMRPVALSGEPYFKERLGCGDLIAADKATYIRLYGRAKEFRLPLAFLRDEMRARIAEWKAIHGELPAVADYVLVQNGDEIALALRDAAPEKPAAKAPLAPTENKPGAPRRAPVTP
jgi:hypothetical protein